MFHPQSPLQPQPEQQPPKSPTKSFRVHYLLTLIYALVFIALIVVWSVRNQGGFDTQLLFGKWNFHHLFMLIGMLIINGNAILVFRLGRLCSKIIVLTIHILLNIIGFVFAVVGLDMAFSFRTATLTGYHMYSLHSWIGIIAVVFYAVQFIFGLVALFPNSRWSSETRQKMASSHKNIGMFVFAGSTVAALTGLLLRSGLTIADYTRMPPETLYVNITALLVLFFSMTLLYLVGSPKYKRVK